MTKLELGAVIDVHVTYGEAPLRGTVIEVSRFGVCVRYPDERGRDIATWFSPSALPGVTNRYIDHLGAGIVNP